MAWLGLSSRSSGNNDKNCSATFHDLEALDCPVCCDALTSPIFQCDNGHIACSTCCDKLRNKCPPCALTIGKIRCRAIERIINAVTVPWPNVELGCTKSFSYGKELTHERECTFSSCTCPARNCNYTGSYKDLHSHFGIHEGERGYSYRFRFGEGPIVNFELAEYTSVVMKEYKAGLMFVVQCFIEPHGVYMTVSCIAPQAGEFSCHISAVVEKYTMTFDFPNVKRVRKLILQTPKEDFMLVPTYFLRGRQALKLRICIRKSKKM